ANRDAVRYNLAVILRPRLNRGFMAKRKKTPEKCYMCDDAGITREHVPPYSFFPEGHRENLITVPSCPKHNNHNSKDVEYIRNVIATSIQVNDVGLSLIEKVMRSYTKSPGLAKRILKNMRGVRVGNEETGLTKIDLDRFNSVIKSIAYALYFRDFGITYPNDWYVIGISLDSDNTYQGLPDDQNDILRMTFASLETVDRDTNHPEVFKYAIFQESPERVVYKLVFYGNFVVYAMGKVSG